MIQIERVKGIKTAANTAAAVTATVTDNSNKKVIFKNCVPVTNCTSEINNTKIDNAKGIHVLMSKYNLI